MNYSEFRVKVHGDHVEASWEGRPTKNGVIRYQGLERDTINMIVKWIREAPSMIKYSPELTLLGEHLYRVLFDGPVDYEFRRSWLSVLNERPKGNEVGLRVILDFDEAPSGLAVLPWEYLYFPGDTDIGDAGFFMAARVRLILSRHVKPSAVLDQHVRESELRVLVVVSEPRFEIIRSHGPQQQPNKEDMTQVDASRILGMLSKLANGAFKDIIKLKVLGRADLPDVAHVDGRATRADLRKAFELEPPHVLHFVGHGKFEGEHGFLALVRDRLSDEAEDLRAAGDEADWIDDEAFARMFEDDHPGLVLVQACEGARSDSYEGFRGVALRLVQRRLPAVVAMQYPIQNRVAEEFALTFYQSLCEGSDIDEAVQAGRCRLRDYLEYHRLCGREFGSPVVYFQDSPESKIKGFLSIVGDTPTREGSSQIATPVCPGCGQPVAEDGNRCQFCRGRYVICPRCGFASGINARYCSNCRAELGALPGRARAAENPPSMNSFMKV